MRCLCRTGRACFFLFCLSPVSLNRLFLSGDETSFLSPGVGCCPRIRSQLGHTPPTGPVWGFAGVVSLAGPQNRTQRHTGPSLFFLPKTSLPLPLKGGGAGYRLSWVGRVGPARSQPGHSGPTGPVCSFAGVTPLSGLQNRTQGHTGPNLVSPPFSLSLSRWQPRQLALQAVIHRLVNRKDRIKQRPVSRSAVQSPYGGGQGFDEILVL